MSHLVGLCFMWWVYIVDSELLDVPAAHTHSFKVASFCLAAHAGCNYLKLDCCVHDLGS